MYRLVQACSGSYRLSYASLYRIIFENRLIPGIRPGKCPGTIIHRHYLCRAGLPEAPHHAFRIDFLAMQQNLVQASYRLVQAQASTCTGHLDSLNSLPSRLNGSCSFEMRDREKNRGDRSRRPEPMPRVVWSRCFYFYLERN